MCCQQLNLCPGWKNRLIDWEHLVQERNRLPDKSVSYLKFEARAVPAIVSRQTLRRGVVYGCGIVALLLLTSLALAVPCQAEQGPNPQPQNDALQEKSRQASENDSLLADILGPLLAALAGSLSGAAVGIWHSKRTERERRTVDIFTFYQQDVFPKQGKAMGVLQFRGCAGSIPLQDIKDTIYVGNWFNFYAALALERGALNKSLRRKIDIDEGVRVFWEAHKCATPKVRSRVGGDRWPYMKQLTERLESH